MNFLRGRFWYSSICLSICACSRIAASERSARSRPFGCVAASCAGAALGASAGTRSAESRAWASRRCCWASSCCVRRCASARSRPGLRGSVTGRGVLARRSWSTLPPRSRFVCANTSALLGLSRVLAFTRTTSSGRFSDFQRIESGSRKCTAIAAACSAIEMPSAAPSTRSLAANIKCILTSALQAFHTLGFLARGRQVILHGRGALAEGLTVHGRERGFQEVRLAYVEAHAGSRLQRRQRGYARYERQPLGPDEILAQHHRLERPPALLLQPAQRPVRFHGALVLVVACIGDLEGAQRREQRVGIARERRPLAGERGHELPLVYEIHVAAKRRRHPGVARHAEAFV